MIVPLTSEEEWQERLSDLPLFDTKANRIVLISPHPDDETLAAGAFLAAQQALGTQVVVIAVTDGENAYPEAPGLAQVRRKEQEDALERLGVPTYSIHRLGLVDSGVEQQKEELVQLLLPFIAADTHVLAPWTRDFHPDHEACGWAAKQAVLRTGATLFWYFFWTWHRGKPEHLDGLKLWKFPVEPSLLAKKLDALSCHRSQLYRVSGDPILPELLLAPARRSFEVFASA